MPTEAKLNGLDGAALAAGKELLIQSEIRSSKFEGFGAPKMRIGAAGCVSWLPLGFVLMQKIGPGIFPRGRMLC
jgi:hypothetical protein